MGTGFYGLSTYRRGDIAFAIHAVMKYMGSKRWMLQNGLGELIAREVQDAERFVDLFSGSGAVATHVATRYALPVFAYDLQTFSAVLTQAVIGRQREVDSQLLWASWYKRAQKL